MDRSNATSDRLVKRREAMNRLGFGISTFRKLEKQGLLPTHRIGRNVYLKSGDLDDLIANPQKLQARSS